MKNRLFVTLAAILVLVFSLTGCPGNPPEVAPPGAPTATSISNARGVFLVDSGSASRSISKTITGRAVLDTTGSDLGAVDTSGVVESAEFVDADGQPVTVEITRAAQLSARYTLIAYNYAESNATAILDLETGALLVIDHAPDNWTRIFSRGTTAWYVSGGSVFALDLATGTASPLSSEAAVYQSSGSYLLDSTPLGYMLPWDSTTWIYADLVGNVYAIDMQNSASIRAQVITTAGTRKNFGFQYDIPGFLSILPGSSSNAKYAHALYDETTGNCFIVRGREIWDNNPEAVGGAELTGGYVLHLYPVIFDPSAVDVMTFNMSSPIAYAVMTGSSTFTSTYVGAGFLMDTSLLSYGDHTYKASTSTIAAYDTSAVPVSHITPNGTTDGQYVANWVFSGGEVYAGPTDTSTAITLVDFSASTVAVHTLVSDPSITSWTVVGGVLFFTNSSGTYKASIDTTTGTLGVVSVYDGGTVTAVTQ